MQSEKDPTSLAIQELRAVLDERQRLLQALATRGAVSDEIAPSLQQAFSHLHALLGVRTLLTEWEFSQGVHETDPFGLPLLRFSPYPTINSLTEAVLEVTDLLPQDPGLLRGVLSLLERIIDLTSTEFVALSASLPESAAPERPEGVDEQLAGIRRAAQHELLTLKAIERSRLAVERVEAAADEAEQIREDVAEASGQVAEGELAIEFDRLAKRDARAAEVFRALTVIVFLAVIGYAAAVAWSAESPSLELAQRLAVAVPVLLLGAYFSREAGIHRDAARWASVLATQLRTLNAYTAGLEPSQATQLRTDFAARVFLTSPDGPPESAGSADTLANAADLLRAARGS